MKKMVLLFCVCSCIYASCNNEAKDSVEKADSANEAKEDATPAATQPDEATSNFLVKAADGGMAEVSAGQLGEKKGTNAGVKRFAAMMVHDHTGANAEVKALAAARNVTLPAATSDDNQQKAAKLGEKTGKDFDKSYMEMMVDDHKKTIDLFEDAEKNSKDTKVKTFITNTLPKLKMHLDSAQAIQKTLR